MGIFSLIVIWVIHLSQRQVLGAYPFEHDVTRVTGIGPPKLWLVFMETRIHLCIGFNQLSAKHGQNLMSVFGCLSTGPKRLTRCYHSSKGDFSLIIHDNALLFRDYSRVIPYVNCRTKTEVNIIHILVHKTFHINFAVTTIAKPFHHTQAYRGLCYMHSSKFVVSFNNHSVEVCGTEYRRSIYIPSYQMDVSLHGYYQIHLANVIGEIELMDHQFVLSIQASHTTDLISWAYFKVQKYFINVEMLYRIRISAITGSRIIIYDGPRVQMPKLSPYENNFNQSYYVSSTFQIVLVYIFIDENFSSQIQYNKDVFTPRKLIPPKQVILKNNTGCGYLSILSWMCTFNIISSRETRASAEIITLDFAGPFVDIHISAGVAIYNVINNTANLVVHLFYNYDLEYRQIPLSVTGSGNELYISVYAYSPYALLSLKFFAQYNPCISIFIGKHVRPSLASIPHFIEKEYIDNNLIVNLHITLNITNQCFVIHVNFLHTEQVQFEYRVIFHFMKCPFIRFDYNRYGVGKEVLDSWVLGKFQLIDGGYYFPFCKIFGNVCRFYLTLMYPRVASYFVATVDVKHIECLQPCGDTATAISNAGEVMEMCDLCKYLWLRQSTNQKYFGFVPNEHITLEHIHGYQLAVISISSLSGITSGGQDIYYSMQAFTVRFSRPRTFKTEVKYGELWRVRREHLFQLDHYYNIYREQPKVNSYKLHRGEYVYFLVAMPTIDHIPRSTDWISFDTQCNKYDATFLTIQDYMELRFIVKSIMHPFLIERIYIPHNYIFKVWFVWRVTWPFDNGSHQLHMDRFVLVCEFEVKQQERK